MAWNFSGGGFREHIHFFAENNSNLKIKLIIIKD